jgi:hypothetical protein
MGSDRREGPRVLGSQRDRRLQVRGGRGARGLGSGRSDRGAASELRAGADRPSGERPRAMCVNEGAVGRHPAAGGE